MGAGAQQQHHLGAAAVGAARELRWLEEVYGLGFEKELIRLLLLEVFLLCHVHLCVCFY